MRPVYDEHVYAGREATVEERCNPIGEITLIKEVADRDEIHQRRRTAGEIIADRRDLDTVQSTSDTRYSASRRSRGRGR
jgi:hypothetical protein